MLTCLSSRIATRSIVGLGLALGASLVAIAPAAAAPWTATFQEGVSPTGAYDVEDTELRSSAPDDSFEVNPRWNIGTYGPVEREVAGFPISLPVDSVVISVTLDVWQNGDSGGAHKQLDLYRITNANFTNESEATWNSANEATASPWATAGGDYDPTVLSSITPTTNTAGTQYTFASSPAFVAAANAALAGDGLLRLLVRTPDEVTFGYESFRGSDNGPSAEFHPRLTLTYVPEPASLGALALGGLALLSRRRLR